MVCHSRGAFVAQSFMYHGWTVSTIRDISLCQLQLISFQIGCMQLNPITLVSTYREYQDIWHTVVIILDGHEAAPLHVSSQEPPIVQRACKAPSSSSFILSPQVQLQQWLTAQPSSPESIRRGATRIATACRCRWSANPLGS